MNNQGAYVNSGRVVAAHGLSVRFDKMDIKVRFSKTSDSPLSEMIIFSYKRWEVITKKVKSCRIRQFKTKDGRLRIRNENREVLFVERVFKNGFLKEVRSGVYSPL